MILTRKETKPTHQIILNVFKCKYCSNLTYTIALVDVTNTNQRNVTHRSGLAVLELKYVSNTMHTIVFNDFTTKCSVWKARCSAWVVELPKLSGLGSSLI